MKRHKQEHKEKSKNRKVAKKLGKTGTKYFNAKGRVK